MRQLPISRLRHPCPRIGDPPCPCHLETSLFIALGGYGRAGKDTVANYLAARHGLARVAFADPLREAALRINPIVRHWRSDGALIHSHYIDLLARIGYERAKDESPDVRPFLERLGTDVGREMFGQDVWVDRAVHRATELGSAVFTDTRFPNELAAARTLGAIDIWIDRPGIVPSAHVSGTKLGPEHFTHTVRNDDSLVTLFTRVDAVLESAGLHLAELAGAGERV